MQSRGLGRRRLGRRRLGLALAQLLLLALALLGLASAASLATGASAVTFNSSGLSNNTLESLGFNPNAVRDSVAESQESTGL